MEKNRVCLWYDGAALDAARFYAETFEDCAVGRTVRAPGDYPNGHEGDVLLVEFEVYGIPCVGLNGGPVFTPTEAFSFQILTEDQAETDRLCDAILAGAPGADLAVLPLPDHYRAAVVRRDEVGMFEGVVSARKDPRKSVHIQDVATPELAPDEAYVAVMASSINFMSTSLICGKSSSAISTSRCAIFWMR